MQHGRIGSMCNVHVKVIWHKRMHLLVLVLVQLLVALHVQHFMQASTTASLTRCMKCTSQLQSKTNDTEHDSITCWTPGAPLQELYPNTAAQEEEERAEALSQAARCCSTCCWYICHGGEVQLP